MRLILLLKLLLYFGLSKKRSGLLSIAWGSLFVRRTAHACLLLLISFIAYLRVHYNDPLLCLTVSATLREKPVTAITPFSRYLASIGEDNVIGPDSPQPEEAHTKEPEQDILTGFVEVNLLEGLFAGEHCIFHLPQY